MNSLCLYLNVRGGSCSRRDADRELLVFLVEGEVTYTFRVADPDSGHVVGAIRTRRMERGRGVVESTHRRIKTLQGGGNIY